jgi:hypothetical protein
MCGSNIKELVEQSFMNEGGNNFTLGNKKKHQEQVQPIL